MGGAYRALSGLQEDMWVIISQQPRMGPGMLRHGKKKLS
jgi:hypothetical protein